MMPDYQFGPFTYDPEVGRLTSAESQLILRDQVNRLLHFFIENRDRLLSREVLMAAIWDDAFVEANTFFQSMNQLRKALGDHADNPTFIKNFPRKGYRWICPVTNGKQQPAQSDLRASRQTKKWALIAGLVFSVALAFWWQGARGERIASKDVNSPQSSDVAQNTHANAFRQTPNVSLAPSEAVSWGANSPVSGRGKVRLTAEMPKNRYPRVFSKARKAFQMGELRHCEAVLNQASEKAIAYGHLEAEAMAQLELSRIARYRDPQHAKAQAQRAKVLYAELGDDRKYYEACYRLILIHLDLDEFNFAESQLQDAIFTLNHSPKQNIYTTLAKGVFALKQGDIPKAEIHLEKLLALKPTQLNNQRYPKILLFEAAVLHAKAQLPQAQSKAMQALEVFQKGPQPLFVMRAQWLLGQIEAAMGNKNQARELFLRAIASGERYQLDFFLANIASSLAELPNG